MKPYEKEFYAPVPGFWVKHLRINIIYQLWRFVVINLKMLKIILKSH